MSFAILWNFMSSFHSLYSFLVIRLDLMLKYLEQMTLFIRAGMTKCKLGQAHSLTVVLILCNFSEAHFTEMKCFGL